MLYKGKMVFFKAMLTSGSLSSGQGMIQ